MRNEHDLLGTREIPDSVYWGIHTSRALENFKIYSQPVNVRIVRAVAVVKKACAQTNAELLFLDKKIAGAIERCCDEIVGAIHDKEFPVSALQGGAGTS